MNAADVREAIVMWPGLYETASGFKFLGSPVSEVPTRLRDARWRGVPRLDASDFRKMGLEVVEARYVGGTRPKRFCQVVVAAEYRGPTYMASREDGDIVLVDRKTHEQTRLIRAGGKWKIMGEDTYARRPRELVDRLVAREKMLNDAKRGGPTDGQ